MTITKRTSTVHTGYLKGRAIKYIVLHYTAGTSSGKGVARNIAAMFGNPNNRAASADYIIDDAEIVQYNGDIPNRYTYAVGGPKWSVNYTPLAGTLYGKCKNNNSISIEMCSSKANKKSLGASDTDWTISKAVVNQAVDLTRHLMATYRIPIDRVIMHHHVTGKLCPQPWCLNTKRLEHWENFKSRLTAAKEEPEVTREEAKEYIRDEVAEQLGILRDERFAADNAPEPDWSKLEGFWKAATEKGLVDGTQPERAAKRDELITILGRLGLIPGGDATERAEKLGMD